MTDQRDWAISIYVPQQTVDSAPAPADPTVQTHSKLTEFFGFGRVEKVGAATVQGQWQDTIAGLMRLTSAVSDKIGHWQIDEVEVGLTLSAKGELLFIAEAGAEASIKLVLKPKA